MKIKFIEICIIFLLTLWGSNKAFGIDLNGYGKSTWGMTLEDVIEAEDGEVIKLAVPEIFPKFLTLAERKDVRFNSYPNPLNGIYQFDPETKKLIQVAFLDKSSTCLVGLYLGLREQLSLKYGIPVYAKSLGKIESQMYGNGEWTENAKDIWKVGSTEIQINYVCKKMLYTHDSEIYAFESRFFLVYRSAKHFHNSNSGNI